MLVICCARLLNMLKKSLMTTLNITLLRYLNIGFSMHVLELIKYSIMNGIVDLKLVT